MKRTEAAKAIEEAIRSMAQRMGTTVNRFQWKPEPEEEIWATAAYSLTIWTAKQRFGAVFSKDTLENYENKRRRTEGELQDMFVAAKGRENKPQRLYVETGYVV